MAGRLRSLAYLKGTQMIRWRETKQQTNNNNNKQRSPLMFNKRLCRRRPEHLKGTQMKRRHAKWSNKQINNAHSIWFAAGIVPLFTIIEKNIMVVDCYNRKFQFQRFSCSGGTEKGKMSCYGLKSMVNNRYLTNSLTIHCRIYVHRRLYSTSSVQKFKI